MSTEDGGMVAPASDDGQGQVKLRARHKTRKTVLRYTTDGAMADSLIAECLQILSVRPNIEVRDTLDETFPDYYGTFKESFRVRATLLALLGFVALGVLTGLWLYVPITLLKDLGLSNQSTIAIVYNGANDWQITGLLQGTLEFDNPSALSVEIPARSAHVMQACLNEDRNSMMSYENPVARNLSPETIPINSTNHKWKDLGSINDQSFSSETLISSPQESVTTSGTQQMSELTVKNRTIDLLANSTILGSDIIYGFFEAVIPTSKPALRPLCYATASDTLILNIPPRRSGTVVLACSVLLNADSLPYPSPPPFYCPVGRELSVLSTPAMSDITRTEIFMKQGIIKVPIDPLTRDGKIVNINDVTSACQAHGSLWIRFRLLNGWVWSFGAGGRQIPLQATPLMEVPCTADIKS